MPCKLPQHRRVAYRCWGSGFPVGIDRLACVLIVVGLFRLRAKLDCSHTMSVDVRTWVLAPNGEAIPTFY